MDPAASQRVAPNRVLLILVLLMAVWLVFQFLPQKKPTPSMAPVVVTESKLNAVGLADNPDWAGLPEFFALCAKHAEWKDGRTRFAYWHPVMKTYSYYFEATRSVEGVLFREIAEPHDPDHYWDEEMTKDSHIRFYYSDPVPVQPGPLISGISDPVDRDIRVKINMNKTAPGLPPAEKIAIPAKPATKP